MFVIRDYKISMILGKVAILGLGLLGGSIGLELRMRNLAERVVAYARRDQTVAEGRTMGAADEISTNLEGTIAESDLVILCTPVFQMKNLAEKIAKLLPKNCLVTDVGSVKQYVISQVTPALNDAGIEFLGSHPMAGSEKTGVMAAQKGIFKGAHCAITPTSNNSYGSIEKLKKFWGSLGGVPMVMEPDKHDEMVARCSHVPHVLSSTLSKFVLNPGWPKEQASLSSTGFRDISRLASGSPEMWKDISLSNKESIINAISEWNEELNQFINALEEMDETAILDFFKEAKLRRDLWLKNFKK